MEHFIRVYDDMLPVAFCEEVIVRFEAADGRFAGRVHGAGGRSLLDEKKKRTTELVITDRPEWSDVDDTLKAAYIDCVNRYAAEFPHLSGLNGQMSSEAFRIKKYDPEGFYEWHMDCVGDGFHRLLAIQYYLTTSSKAARPSYNSKR